MSRNRRRPGCYRSECELSSEYRLIVRKREGATALSPLPLHPHPLRPLPPPRCPLKDPRGRSRPLRGRLYAYNNRKQFPMRAMQARGRRRGAEKGEDTVRNFSYSPTSIHRTVGAGETSRKGAHREARCADSAESPLLLLLTASDGLRRIKRRISRY